MENSAETPPKDQGSTDSLEGSETVVESAALSGETSATPGAESGAIPDTRPAAAAPGSPTPKAPRGLRLRGLLRHTNIYLLGFVLLIIIAIAIFVIAILHSKTKTVNPVSSQNLSQSSLSQLANSDETVGSSTQVLTIQSNAVFDDQVLVRSDLQVAGKLEVGGSLSLSGIAVSGTSVFAAVQVNNGLSVAGDTALQGQLTIQKNLNVNGNGTFSGALSATQITASTLQLNGELVLTHHISAGGVTPSRSSGSNLGDGGTTSISGSDTAGSISINTGSNPSAGCYINVTFASPYNATPHVVITPIGSAAGGLGYYVNRSNTSFSVCSTTAAGSNQTFGFDYFIVD